MLAGLQTNPQMLGMCMNDARMQLVSRRQCCVHQQCMAERSSLLHQQRRSLCRRATKP
jgi:hypothetical protein